MGWVVGAGCWVLGVVGAVFDKGAVGVVGVVGAVGVVCCGCWVLGGEN